MSHDGFLQAILDDPDDDTHRLVYADWLDEHGDPARAEFIRVQVELNRGPARSREELAARRALAAREEELLERFGEEWEAPLQEFVRERVFRRGFVEDVVIEAGAFVENAEVLFRNAPVHRARLYWGLVTPLERARFMGRVAECPQLARLRALDLSGSAFGSDGLRALAASEYLTNLTELNLADAHVGDGGIRALVAAPWLSGLEVLDLRRNDVGPNGVRALAARLVQLEAEGRLRLWRLEFAHNRGGTEWRRAIFASPELGRFVRW
jgi:uncharacterized protein (TIGR02996 family)